MTITKHKLPIDAFFNLFMIVIYFHRIVKSVIGVNFQVFLTR
jgi:hypothetical protein